jgi:hypothetical protein
MPLKRSLVRILALISVVTALAACAGTPFKWDQARKIEKGMTTKEVTDLVGAPNRIDARDGALIYVWVWVNTLSGSSRTLRVDFRDGKAISVPPIPDEFTD